MKTTTAPSTHKPDPRPRPKRDDGAGTSTAAAGITPEQLRQMIAEEAYLRAEQRGFQAGDPTADWLTAEVEITRRLAQGQKDMPRD